MNMLTMPHWGIFDLLLIIVVTLAGTTVAYVKNPFLKSFLLLMPFPSSLALLALNKPLDASCVLGLLLLFMFFRTVELLYNRFRLNIFAAIITATILYTMEGIALKPLLSQKHDFFWISFMVTVILSMAIYVFMGKQRESGSRTSIPIYWKFPMLLVICCIVVTIKSMLGGFILMFPMVGIIGAYESRHCLKTVSRQTALYGVTFAPLAAVCYLTQDKLGVPYALGLGWCAYLITLALLRKLWFPKLNEYTQPDTFEAE